MIYYGGDIFPIPEFVIFFAIFGFRFHNRFSKEWVISLNLSMKLSRRGLNHQPNLTTQMWGSHKIVAAWFAGDECRYSPFHSQISFDVSVLRPATGYGISSISIIYCMFAIKWALTRAQSVNNPPAAHFSCQKLNIAPQFYYFLYILTKNMALIVIGSMLLQVSALACHAMLKTRPVDLRHSEDFGPRPQFLSTWVTRAYSKRAWHAIIKTCSIPREYLGWFNLSCTELLWCFVELLHHNKHIY